MLCSNGDIVQLARTPALQAGGRGFKSHYLHHMWINPVAQLTDRFNSYYPHLKSCGISLMVELQPSKLNMPVRFWYPAPLVLASW